MWQRALLRPQLVEVISKRLFQYRRPVPKETVFRLNQKWRRERGLPLNPNTEGVLTDSPDYSFVDGRPTPFGIGQMNRIVKQQQIAEEIIKLTAEVDFAVSRHNKLQQEEQERRQHILDSKLKPKGMELLRKKK